MSDIHELTPHELEMDEARISNHMDALEEAARRNEARPMLKKALNLGHISTMDVIHEQANEMNEQFNQDNPIVDKPEAIEHK